jgi:hypothetical protein
MIIMIMIVAVVIVVVDLLLLFSIIIHYLDYLIISFDIYILFALFLLSFSKSAHVRPYFILWHFFIAS